MNDTACLELVDLCYQAVEDATAWTRFVESLTRVLDADAGDFVVENYGGGDVVPFGSVGFDPGFRIDYDESFLGENPWIQQLRHLPLRRAFSNELEPDDFESSAYFNEWVRPQGFRHAIGGLVDYDGRSAVHIGVLRHRGRPVFTAADAQVFDRLFPHLHRALRLRGRLDAAGAGRSPVEEMIARLRVPAFLLGENGRLLRLNAAADAMLSAGGEVTSLRGRLGLRDQAADRQLEAALARASAIEGIVDGAGRTEIAVPRKDGAGPPLLLDIVPIRSGRPFADGRPACLALLTDPGAGLPDPGQTLARLWGLTPTESGLAVSIANGMALSEYAERTGMKIGTARWHLKNTEAKLGVNTLAGVVTLVQGALRRA